VRIGTRGVGRLDRGLVGSVGCVEQIGSVVACGADRLDERRAGAVRFRGSVDSIIGWLTGLGDGPMGPSPRVMNNI
jgi:hypothetical protein